jgi:hypothetical protein
MVIRQGRETTYVGRTFIRHEGPVDDDQAEAG